MPWRGVVSWGAPRGNSAVGQICIEMTHTYAVRTEKRGDMRGE